MGNKIPRPAHPFPSNPRENKKHLLMCLFSSRLSRSFSASGSTPHRHHSPSPLGCRPRSSSHSSRRHPDLVSPFLPWRPSPPCPGRLPNLIDCAWRLILMSRFRLIPVFVWISSTDQKKILFFSMIDSIRLIACISSREERTCFLL